MRPRVFQLLAERLGFQNRLDDMRRGLGSLPRARKQIGIAVTFDAALGNDSDEQTARDGKVVGRRHQRFGVGHFELFGVDFFDLHRSLLDD